MLEHLHLLIEWPIWSEDSVKRLIRDLQTRDVLGKSEKRRMGVTRYVFGDSPEMVYESPDNSLLCMIHRDWPWQPCLILDAEGVVIGRIRRRDVLNANASVLAKRTHDGRYATPTGVELATWEKIDCGMSLRFHPRVIDEPITKMALLAAALQIR